MKSKKPFLIVCAAALTLAFALPFMGVFAFADDSSSVSFVGSPYAFTYSISSLDESDDSSFSGTVILNSSETLSLLVGVVYSFNSTVYNNGSWDNGRAMYNSLPLSNDSSSPTVISYPYDLTFSCSPANPSISYFVLESPPPPDPLAPVSDGMDTMISVFGDVIDYIINTPDVAIFVAISVASCAIIPMGIILIKKLIKGF